MFDHIIISGSLAIDRLMSFDGSFEDKLSGGDIANVSVSILMDHQEMVSGGVGANIATHTATLGLTPILLGAVGSDAADYLGELDSIGINTEHVYVSSLHTASFTAFTDSGGNQIGGFYPGAMADAAKTNLDSWKDTRSLVVISANDAMAMRAHTEQAKELGLTVFYDPGQQTNNISGDDLKAGIANADILMVNEFECSVIEQKTGLTEADLRAQVETVVVTRGSGGLDISTPETDGILHVDALGISNVVDPTGAGDAFRSGYIYGLSSGWTVQKSCQLGIVMSGLIIQKHGPRHRLTLDEIKETYHNAYNEEITI